MQPLHKSCYHLDRRCYEKFGLTEDILMENASRGMAEYIKDNFKKGSSILIVAGSGNNGADGIVLARQLYGLYDVRLYVNFGVHSDMAKIQLKRAQKSGVKIVTYTSDADIIVDALFGAGLNRALDSSLSVCIEKLNAYNSFKIACDIPTGISETGNPLPIAFKADVTITMGALKASLYSDNAKDFVGEIHCVDLGLPRATYDMPSDNYLLDASDLQLPSRTQKSVHKGTYGHLAVIVGEKEGAGILSALASLHFGVGLATVVGEVKSQLPYSLMQAKAIPYNTTAIALGMGFGSDWDDDRVDVVIKSDAPLILDADIFHTERIITFLEQNHRSLVLTPHPKEFVSLWNRLYKNETLDIPTLQANRLSYLRRFCLDYPSIVLLLKGANSIIAQNKKCFVNPHGSAKLSKGGSGDVLSGLIGALLAQGYKPLEATISASLALSFAAQHYPKGSYAMLPTDLIEEIAQLEKMVISN